MDSVMKDTPKLLKEKEPVEILKLMKVFISKLGKKMKM